MPVFRILGAIAAFALARARLCRRVFGADLSRSQRAADRPVRGRRPDRRDRARRRRRSCRRPGASRSWSRTCPAPAATPASPWSRRRRPTATPSWWSATGFIVNPSMYAKVPYDPIKDFAPITLVAASPNVISANLQVPAKSLKELIDAHQGQSGKIQLRAAGDRLDPASRGRTVQAEVQSRSRHRAVQRRGAGDQFDARRPHADCLHGAAAGDGQCPRRQAARHRAALHQALAATAGRADQHRSRAFPIWKAIRSPASSRPPERRRRSSTAGATRSPRRSPRRTSSSAWRRWALRRSPTRRLNSANGSRPRWRDGPRSCTTPRSGRIRMRGRLGQSALHVCIADQFETAQRRRPSKM